METERLSGVARSAAAPDTALVEGLRRGDSGAHAELRDRYGPPLYGFAAVRLGGDEGAAEDVMVQTLADACRNIRSFDARRSPLSAWMYGIARRKIEGERRKRRARKSVPPGLQVPMESMAEVAAGGDPASRALQRLEAARLVADLARLLSETEMEVLTLHCVEGFSMREIGRVVGRSEKAVDSLLRRAKQKARERLVRDDG